MTSEIRKFQNSLMTHGGLDASMVAVPGFSLCPSEDRLGSAVASCYTIGEHTVVYCDPELVSKLESFGDEHPDADRSKWLAWVLDLGADLLGSGVMRVRSSSAQPISSADAGVVALSAAEPEEVARIHAFLDQCDEDDIDEADIDRESLDPVIRCTTDSDGAITAFASALPWDALPDWWDIGVLTMDAHRRAGLGVRCVSAVIAGIEEADGIALYRHDPANEGSAGLAASLGFEVATALDAVRFGSDPDDARS